jgi:hypothetical protein
MIRIVTTAVAMIAVVTAYTSMPTVWSVMALRKVQTLRGVGETMITLTEIGRVL